MWAGIRKKRYPGNSVDEEDDPSDKLSVAMSNFHKAVDSKHGHRRILTGTGLSLDIELEDDDKNTKAEASGNRIALFALFLFLFCLAASLSLGLIHFTKNPWLLLASAQPGSQAQDRTFSRLNEPSTASNNGINYINSAIESSENHSQKVPKQNTRRDDLPATRMTPRSASSSSSLSFPDLSQQSEKPDWQGCLYELPSPDPAERHIVPPPPGSATLVCCNSTKGVLNIAVHPSWAPHGAKRFLDMVRSGFFSTRVGLFRALRDFLVQFGLAGDPAVHKAWQRKGNLPDDPQWLPAGPPGRTINGTSRFQKGYLAYAGAGKNSRGTQLIMAFRDNLYLGGGSPWEVPWGQVFGAASMQTLRNIYTGYGEKVSQGKIMNRGKAYLETEFPLLDYITACAVTVENVPWVYHHSHPY